MTDEISIDRYRNARTIIDQASDAFIQVDSNSIIIDWNARAQIMFGWSHEQAVGRILSDTIIPPQYREVYFKGLENFKQTDEGPVLSTTIEISALHREGHEFPVELAIFPITSEGTSSFCAFVRDISERKQAELEIREREDKLKKSSDALRQQADMLNSIYDAVVMRSLDGTINYWNTGAEKMYGFTKDEAVGKTTHHLLNTKFPQPLQEIEDSIIKHSHWDGEVLHYTNDGRRLIVYSRHSLKTDEQGNPAAVLEINSDITVYKQAEQRRLALTEMKRLNIELEQFAYVASHDLQEPLRAVAGGLQILERRYKDKLDEEANELIKMAVDGATRMRSLISDLLTLSQVNSSKDTFEPVDLTDVFEQAVANLSVIIKETSATVSHDPLPKLIVERTRMVQLFQNLLSNAIKFRSPTSPSIHFGAMQTNGQWLFSVKDNGIGFEQELADRIFEPFKRLHSRDKYPGTGIGLAICKRIIERHGGNIWAESEPEKGTTFYFTIAENENNATS